MNCSLPGSFVHGIFQARRLDWVAISFSRGSSWLRNRTLISCIAGRFFTDWAMREAHNLSGRVLFLSPFRSLVGYSPWDHKESDTTERLSSVKKSGQKKKKKEIWAHIKRNMSESVLMRWMNLEPIMQSKVSQKDKNKYRMLMHIYGIQKDGTDEPILGQQWRCSHREQTYGQG